MPIPPRPSFVQPPTHLNYQAHGTFTYGIYPAGWVPTQSLGFNPLNPQAPPPPFLPAQVPAPPHSQPLLQPPQIQALAHYPENPRPANRTQDSSLRHPRPRHPHVHAALTHRCSPDMAAIAANPRVRHSKAEFQALVDAQSKKRGRSKSATFTVLRDHEPSAEAPRPGRTRWPLPRDEPEQPPPQSLTTHARYVYARLPRGVNLQELAHHHIRVVVRTLGRLNWSLMIPQEDFARRCCNILFYLRAPDPDLRPPPPVPWLAPPRHIIEQNQDAADAYDAARDALATGQSPPSAAVGPPLVAFVGSSRRVASQDSTRRAANRHSLPGTTKHEGTGDVDLINLSVSPKQSRLTEANESAENVLGQVRAAEDVLDQRQAAEGFPPSPTQTEPIARRTRSRHSLG